LLEVSLAIFEASFFDAQGFQLLGQLLGLASHSGGLLVDRGFLLAQGGFAALEVSGFALQAFGNRFSGGQALVHGGQFRSGSGQFVTFAFHEGPQLRDFFAEPEALRFGFGAAASSGLVLHQGLLGALLDGSDFAANAREFILANRKIKTEARQVALHLLVAVLGSE
jgi:hypothetical protein